MMMHFVYYIPKPLKKYLKKEGKHTLSHKEIEECGMYEFLIDGIVNDFGMQDWYTRYSKYNYITNRNIDISLIEELSSAENKMANLKLQASVNHLLPIVSTPNINDLVSLRKNEGLAFIEYRKAFNSVLNLIDTGEYNLSEAMYDIVNPEIEKIKKTIKKAKNDKLITLGKDVTISSALLGVGLFSGILPANIGELASIIGGFDLAKSLIKDISELAKKPDDIKNNPYYFLWKCSRL